jgi:hypothetical protein
LASEGWAVPSTTASASHCVKAKGTWVASRYR